MGKITYRPNRHSKKTEELNMKVQEHHLAEITPMNALEKDDVEGNSQAAYEKIAAGASRSSIIMPDNIKPIGDLECDYAIYLEDYVYTYLYQYALVDLSTENSAVLLGQFYPESKEAVIRGIIPVPMDKLSGEGEWIDEEVLKEVEKERAQYFKNQQIIGWMHMQPGYGTMLTMKELREHRRVFGENPSLFMLVDAVNKIETLYAYEDEELKEQTGYYMYYERNEEMQQYMLEHPFVKKEAKTIEDTVVNQFKEIGKLRKQQYLQRKNVNATVIAASIILIGLTAVIVKMNDNKNIKSVTSSGAIAAKPSQAEDPIQFIIEQQPAISEKDLEQVGTIAEPQKVEIEEEIMTSNEAEATVETETEVKAEEKVKDEINSNQKEEKENLAMLKEEKENISYEEYVVKEGDTLANISYNQYGSAKRSKEIAQANDLSNTNYIRVGQTLKLPVD